MPVMGGAFAATRLSLERASMRPRHDGYIGFQHAAGRETENLLRGEIASDAFADRLEAAWRASFAAKVDDGADDTTGTMADNDFGPQPAHL